MGPSAEGAHPSWMSGIIADSTSPPSGRREGQGGASPCSILGAAAAGHRPWADKEAHRTAVKKRKHMNTCPATKRPARSEFLSCEQTRGIFKQP
ncbi:hypothetical protein BDA96_07G152600 [Sorghum bicolor]|uniref:Uncharacterized protein n=2 Tax=Sorghum bicolor TaxID=4558 RepID=A0A921UA03_SORBI|nr:hypothetical protein BDA96_07G152600 [Sorghum bicolor]OQU80541.1 hypothetical protein SORBI_3007G141801 [Sorghum bicolor]